MIDNDAYKRSAEALSIHVVPRYLNVWQTSLLSSVICLRSCCKCRGSIASHRAGSKESMAENGPQPPKISISRAWTSNSQRDTNAQENQESKTPTQTPTYETWRPRPWKHSLQTKPYGFKQAKHDPLQWKRKWTKGCFATGRVLIIDYITNHENASSGDSGKHHVAVAAQEFETLKSLEEFYVRFRGHYRVLCIKCLKQMLTTSVVDSSC